MMKQLLKKINEAIAQEKELATKDNGPIRSRHEGYGVLAEELGEARHEINSIRNHYEWLCYSFDSADMWEDKIAEIRTHARLCAAEMVQVASVCDRILDAEEPVCEACKIDLSEGGEN